jgi:phospholipase/carboxylesterase
MVELQATRWGPATGGTPKQLVVLCHGVGADGQDLIDLGPHWGPSLPDAAFSAPDAPEPYDGAPFGRQWWPIGDRDPARMAAGVAKAQPMLDAYIDAELARLSLPPDAYALMGFSQGAMMVLYAGLRRATPPRAILAFSGALIAPQDLPNRRNSAPVLLVHGESDDVVPAFRSRDAEAALKAAGVPVESLFVPGLGHGIDPSGLETGAAALRRGFGL